MSGNLRRWIAVWALSVPGGCFNPTFKESSGTTAVYTSTTGAETAVSGSLSSSGDSVQSGDPPTSEGTTSTSPTTSSATSWSSSSSTSSSTGAPEIPLGLCERLGSTPGAEALTTAVFNEVFADPRINVYFLRQSVDKSILIKRFAALILAAGDCPGGAVPDGLDTKHAAYKISSLDFMNFVEDATAGFAAHQAQQEPPTLTAADAEWFVGALGAWEATIVSPEGSDYQEFGRYPAFLATATAAAEDIAADPMLNVMFDPNASEDFITCLARYFVNLTAPLAAYGDEPLWYPDMPSCGFLNEDSQQYDQYPDITAADFANFLEVHIRNALMEHAAMGADIEGLISALWSLCPKVVTAFDEKKQCPGLAKDVVFTSEEFWNIPSDKADGTLDSMTCVTMFEPDDPDYLPYVGNIEVVVDMYHLWAGEVSIKVVNGDTSVTALLRPGSALGDSGQNCMYNGDCGTSANLDAPVRFRDGASTEASEMGEGLGPADDICKGVDPCEFAPVSPFSQFLGAPVAGPWKVCIGDHTNNPMMPTPPGNVTKVELFVESLGFQP